MNNQIIIYLHGDNTRPSRVNIEDLINHLNDSVYIFQDDTQRPDFKRVEELLTLEGQHKIYYHYDGETQRPVKDSYGILTIRMLPTFDEAKRLIMILFNSNQTDDPPRFISFLDYTLNENNEIDSIEENVSFFTPALPYQGGVAFNPKKINAISCYSWHTNNAEIAKGSPIIDLFNTELERIDQFTFENAETLQALNLRYSNSGRYVGVGLSGSLEGQPTTFAVFEVSNNKLELISTINAGGSGRKCGFTSDDEYVAIAHNPAILWDGDTFLGFDGPGLTICKFNNGKLRIVSQYEFEGDGTCNTAEFSPDDSLLIVTSFTNNQIYLFSHDVGNIVLLDQFQFEDYPWEATWHPSGKFIAVSQRGNPRLRIFSVENDTLTQTDSKTLNGRSLCVTFSEDGKNLVVATRSTSDRVFAFTFNDVDGILSTESTASYMGPAGSVHTTSIDLI